MIQSSTTIRPHLRVVFRKLGAGSGGVILHLGSAAYHGVNETGSLIWSLMGDGPTLGSLVQSVRLRLDDAPDDLAADVSEFVEGLATRGLVVLEPAGARVA